MKLNLNIYEAKIMWNRRIFTATVAEKGYDLAIKEVRQKYPDCCIISIRRTRPA